MASRLLVLGAVCALLRGAEPSLLDYAMPDAQALLGIRIERLRQSKVAESLWKQGPGSEAEMSELTRLTGFDPWRDLEEVLIATAGGSKPTALLIARGSFAATDLAAAVRERAKRRENFQGVEIFLSGEPEEPMALAFLSDTVLVAGNPVNVRGAIGRRGRAGLPAGELRRRAEELSGRFDIWGYSIAPVRALAARAPKEKTAGILEGDVVKAIEEAGGGVRLDGGVEMEVKTVSRTEQDASNLANAVRFFTGLLQARDPASASYLRDLRVEGRTMLMSVRIPEAELTRLMGMFRAGRTTPGKPAAPAEGGVTIYSSPSDMGIVKIPAPKPQP
jgi:hypothetical protein